MTPSISSCSETSEDDDDQMLLSSDSKPFSAALRSGEVKIMDEDQVFKPVPASEEEATFVLKDAIIFTNDSQNPKIANLLEIQFDEPSILVVYGRLVLETDEYRFVKKTAHKSSEDAYIQIKSVAFSIGSDAGRYPVWAYGLGRWFEINPRPEYEEMYHHMVEGVTFYYALTDLYDEKPNARVELALSRCGQRKGGADGFLKIVQAVKSHGGFLLAQMMKPDQDIQWETTEIFQWLAGECLEEYKYLKKKANKVFQPLPEISLEIPTLAPWPHTRKSIDISEDEEEFISDDQLQYPQGHRGSSASSSTGSRRLSSRSRRGNQFSNSNPPNSQTIINKSGKNASMTRIMGLDDPAPGEPSGSILAKLALAGAKQNNSNDFSIKMLVAWVNRCFSVRSKFGAKPEKGGISDHNFAADIVTAHALSILDYLPVEWRNRRLGRDLRGAPKEDMFIGLTTQKQRSRRQEIRDEAAAFKLKLRRETNVFNKRPESTHHNPVGRPPKVETSTTSLNTVRPGRVSGKAAVLRIPGTSINRQISDDDESSSDSVEVVAGPARKRRRASPPEMGDDEEEEATFGRKYNLPIRETELSVKIEPLPDIVDLSPAARQQLEDEKQRKLDVVHKEAALNNRTSTYLEEFLAARKRGPIIRSPLY